MRAALCIVAAATASASAQFSYLGVERHLVIEVLPDHDTLLSRSVDSHGFEDFNESIDDVLTNSAGIGARAYASQQSQLRDGYFHASGTAGGFWSENDPLAFGRGTSSFYVSLRFLQDTDYTFRVSGEGDSFGYLLADAFTGVPVFHADGSTSVDRTITGTIAAGEYLFQLDFEMRPRAGEGYFDMTFTAPAPGTAAIVAPALLATARRRRRA